VTNAQILWSQRGVAKAAPGGEVEPGNLLLVGMHDIEQSIAVGIEQSVAFQCARLGEW
jgi:hypothetical protein